MNATAQLIDELPSGAYPQEADVINKQDKEWIASQINEAIAAVRDDFQPSGWKRLGNLIKVWVPMGGTAVASVGLFATMLTITLAEVNKSRTHDREDAAFAREDQDFKRHTSDTLQHLDESLKALQVDLRSLQSALVSSRTVTGAASLPRDLFEKNLGKLRAAMERTPSPAEVSDDVLRAIALRLGKADETAADYWPTATAFVSYASRVNLAAGSEATSRVVRLSGGRDLVSLSLDNVDLRLEGGQISDSVIRNSHVTFTGNATRLRSVLFVDCTFDMPSSVNPSEHLRQVTRQLLAAGNLRQVQLNVKS